MGSNKPELDRVLLRDELLRREGTKDVALRRLTDG